MQEEGKLLSQLDQVPWATRRDAYGPATETPKHIRGLASESIGDREAAYDFFYTNILHQGSVYEAAIDAVPFLIELLGNDRAPDKAGLVRLLAQLHGGGSWHANHENVNFLAEKSKTPEWQKQKAIELEWIGRIHAAIRAGLDQYLALLKNADAPIRLATCELLAWCKGSGDRLRKALDESLASDPDAKVRANALSALVILGLLKPDALLSFVDTDTPEPLQLTAVLWLHLTDADREPPTSASEKLVQTLDHPEKITSQLEDVSLIGDPWAAIARGLSRCSGPLRGQALFRLCANADAAPWIPDERAFGILALALPTPFSPETILSESQRMAIACIARKAWGGMGEYVNMIDALRAYKLPTREEEVETLLQMQRGAFRPKAKAWVAGDEGTPISKPWWKFW